MTDIAPPNVQQESLRVTPLDALHRRLGARMTPFAGYWLPVQFASGIIAEHQACRTGAALFDVSHMGQVSLHGEGADAALERLVPGDIVGLREGRQSYTLLLNEAGGVLDDLMVARYPDRLVLVVNASRTQADVQHLAGHLPDHLRLELHEDRALLALQGPAAAQVLSRLAPDCAGMRFMDAARFSVNGAPCWVTRSGYTGEDGFEISVPAEQAELLAERLLAEPEVQPAGLGARDSLRLEAGLPLYGADLDELTSPVEAAMPWAVARRRRADWSFPGAAAIRDQLENGPVRLRVGLRPDGRAPARGGAAILAADHTEAGAVTSGGFSPSLSAPIAMGYVRRDQSHPGTAVQLNVRDKNLPAQVCPLPFVPHRYCR